MRFCENATCRRPFSPRPHTNQRFCHRLCASEQWYRRQVVRRKHIQARVLQRRALPPGQRELVFLDRLGSCPGCLSPDRWLWREKFSLVVLCGICMQIRQAGEVYQDPRLQQKRLRGIPGICPKGHTDGFFKDYLGRRRCRACHRHYNARYKRKKRLERRLLKQAAKAA